MRGRASRSTLVVCLLTFGAVLGLSAAAPAALPSVPTLELRPFTNTHLQLTDVLWTGSRFVYVDFTDTAIYSSDPGGTSLRPFAQLPRLKGETRCTVAPAGYGFPARQIFCQTPDDRIFRINPSTGRATLFASLPSGETDGAIAFDLVGRFGHRLLAATGRSGTMTGTGGSVYAVDHAGKAAHIGDYSGPGGADDLVVAPARFGSAGGSALLTVDGGPTSGKLVAMDANGRTRVIAHVNTGPNALVVVRSGTRSAAAAGFYLADTYSKLVYFAPAAELSRYAGDVLMGAEIRPRFWIVAPKGTGFVTRMLRTHVSGPFVDQHNFEGADYVGGACQSGSCLASAHTR